ELPVLDLPLDYPRPQLQSFEGAVVRQHMDGGVREAVQRLSRETGATEFMVLLSGLMTLLGKYSRQEDIIVGSPVSGRLHHDTEGMVGMFVNTLALRGQPVSDKVYLDFLAELKDVCLKGFEHQAYPFEDLVEAVQVRRDMSRHPIFDVMFVLQNNEEEAMEAEGIQFGEVTAESRTAKFDVTMTVIPTATGYTVEWEYASRLFTAETIRRMSAHYKQLLQALVEGPQQRLGELEIVTAEEKALLLQGFHAAPASYPADQNIKSLFEEQVRKTPHRIAVAYEEEQLSYEELNARANVVAHHLLSYKTAGENIVGLLLERNINLVVGILGVVKAGCTYLPIDPEAPADRISYTLEDSQARLLLTNANRMSGEADGKANEPSETTNRKSETSDTCRESE
ncbi:condensation domain-containing protein, partial [Paenibacillus cisolokensis]|uniref:condensation domain-containing protein n=1 Tax=Paenibacillus cisolokensis TaxID=1658519 RepID=UPI003D271C23